MCLCVSRSVGRHFVKTCTLQTPEITRSGICATLSGQLVSKSDEQVIGIERMHVITHTGRGQRLPDLICCMSKRLEFDTCTSYRTLVAPKDFHARILI